MEVFRNPSKESVLNLLASCDLPTGDLDNLDCRYFLGVGDNDSLKGVVGSELYGECALLRSLAVLASARLEGIGASLLSTQEKFLSEAGVTSVYLLTDTAQQYFRKFGYCEISRNEAPVSIQNTKQFSGLCGKNAVFMIKKLAK
ncbi:MAG: GNAT family N-acetyltransferase [Proteobacteria bacterium]|nr:MAG: GNAT family N-acetyltransferase [Pseudomonadota bacterium]